MLLELHRGVSLQIGRLFSVASDEVVTMQNPNDEQRRAYFEELLCVQALKPPSTKKHIGNDNSNYKNR